MAPHLVLVVDDEPSVAEGHARLLENLGYRSVVECDPEKVGSRLADHPAIDLVLLDVRMPRVGGLDVLRRVRLLRPDIGVIMATVVNDIESAVAAIKSGAYNYLLKPLQAERLSQVLASYFANRMPGLVDDPRFSPFVTRFRGFERIFRTVQSFAQTDVMVLIQGETGTGKDLIAQIIHSLSPRASRPFLAVNLPAISPALFESELFGHRKGAFTGALMDHRGYFEEAGDGTLFLDEIGELSAEQQTKLLRVLQSRTFSRVGEASSRQIAARPVLATNRNLAADTKDGRFRADLYYRISSHTIDLPPLSERDGDIGVLADFFLKKYGSQFGRAIEGWHPDTLRILSRYRFPGNVRELEGIVSAAVLIEQGAVITPSALPHHVRLAERPDGGGELASLRYQAVMQALVACGGNQKKTAQRLGIDRTTLWRLLRRFKDSLPEE
ncbi:MAG: sigma-54-dependent Fis family transcriptional regulator [Candidatus Riflebacteria bacterium]|nr:sigma-54-dependent Fis family transcriptional regulator [Candidatus Riflebacteria bacterium]